MSGLVRDSFLHTITQFRQLIFKILPSELLCIVRKQTHVDQIFLLRNSSLVVRFSCIPIGFCDNYLEPFLMKIVFIDHFNLIHQVLKFVFLFFTGIIYCFSRKDSEEVADSLSKHGIKAQCYHADLSPEYKSKVHRAWSKGNVHVSGIKICP